MDDRLNVEPFSVDHTRDVMVSEYEFLAENVQLWSEAVSVFWDGELIVIAGGMISKGKVGGWILFTENINTRSFLAFHKAMLEIIKEYKSYGKTIFVHVDPSNERGLRWAKLMGFELIGEETVKGQKMLRFEQ